MKTILLFALMVVGLSSFTPPPIKTDLGYYLSVSGNEVTFFVDAKGNLIRLDAQGYVKQHSRVQHAQMVDLSGGGNNPCTGGTSSSSTYVYVSGEGSSNGYKCVVSNGAGFTMLPTVCPYCIAP